MPSAFEKHVSGATPRNWAKTLERLRVVNEYLKIKKPRTADAARCAHQLGIKQSYFYKLVRTFKEGHPVPVDGRAQMSGRIGPAAETVIADVITDFGPDAKLSQIIEEGRRRCIENNIPPPSTNAFRARFAAARVSSPTSLDMPELVADHSGLLLPIQEEDGTVSAAVVTVLVHTPSGRILGHHLNVTPPGADDIAGAIADALKAPKASPGRSYRSLELQLNRDDNPAWETLLVSLTEAGIRTIVGKTTPRSAGRVIMRTLGTRLGRIDLAPRSTFVTRPTSPNSGPPVSLEQARSTVRQIIEERDASLEGAALSLRNLISKSAASSLEASFPISKTSATKNCRDT